MVERVINAEEADGAMLMGIPTLALLPAKNFYFNVSREKYKMVIPRKGKFVEIDPAFYSEEDGDFSVVSDDGKTFNIATITKVLFATKRYPDLKDNQLLCPVALVVVEDKVEIFAQVVTMHEAPKNSELGGVQ